MSPVDLEYYRRRVATERKLAKSSERADVAAIHEELARQYNALIDHEELRPRPNEIPSAVQTDRRSPALSIL